MSERQITGRSLARVYEAYELTARGVISGRDVAELLAKLSELWAAKLTVERENWEGDVEALISGVHVGVDAFCVRITPQKSLVARASSFSDEALDTARLLAPSLANCLRTPIALRALAADRSESLDTALVRLSAVVRLDERGHVIECSELAKEHLSRHLNAPSTSERVRSAMQAVARNFMGARENLQRLAHTLLVSLAYLPSAPSSTSTVIGVLDPIDTIHNQDLEATVAPLLSQTELAVVTGLVSGERENAIGQAMGVSPQTIRTHRKHIYEKLGVSSRLELAILLARLPEVRC